MRFVQGIEDPAIFNHSMRTYLYGRFLGELPAGYADRIHAVLPRLHAAPVLYDTIVGQALDKPHKAPPFSMPGELVRQQTQEVWPTWKQLMTQSPSWNDYDGYQSNA